MASRKSEPPKEPARPRLRLERIEIRNYKAIDHLVMELPAPSSPDQLDVFVLGSRNGVGKTSFLECCALSVLTGHLNRIFREGRGGSIALSPLLRAGASEARIVAHLRDAQKTWLLPLIFDGENRVTLPGTEGPFIEGFWAGLFPNGGLLASLLGTRTEPLILPPLLLFHSNRKVREGSMALSGVVEPVKNGDPPSTFKLTLIRALMARSGLLEGVGHHEEAALEQLSGLLRDFADVELDKLRPGPDSALELRVKPRSGGPSFSFDGLSSGQKEVISTLFLIWFATRDQPSIVLIDEPELHLNAEWQRLFLQQLAQLAPRNQYILATHSEEIFASVYEDRRLMLRRD